MGNSKSRHAYSGGNGGGPPSSSSARKHAKHNSGQQHQYPTTSNSRYSNSNHYNTYNHISSTDAFPGQLVVPNDSGHYSVHGSLAPVAGAGAAGGLTRGELFPGGSFHANLSSPGRLDQQKTSSDSSLQLQYGSRVKRAAPSGSGAGGMGFGISAANTGALRTSGGYMSLSGEQLGGYNNISNNNNHGQEMIYQPQHQQYPHHIQQQQQQSSSQPTSPLRSHGRMSSQLQQQQYGGTSSPLGFHSHQPYHQYQRMSNDSPTPMIGHMEDEANRVDGRIPSLAALTLEMNDGRASIQQQTTRYQEQDYVVPPFSQRQSGYQTNQGTNPITAQGIRQPNTSEARTRNDYVNSTNILPKAKNNNHSSTHTKQQPFSTATVAAGADAVNGTGTGTGAGALPRASEIFAKAGPLLDVVPSSAASNRPLAPDQVFARLAKQYPTNPRETDKRERVYRWLDEVSKALTFNPDTNIPGWIIPVVPDELDQPDSLYYIDRITYELDLVAPIGKPFRKAIDVNCASGEWAMDLSLKYPRTIVYALDPTLNLSRLPQHIPENCRFKLRDVKDQEGEFDLVHQRLGAFRTQISDWTPHFAELGRLTRAGGWIQLAECNGMIVRAGTESLKVNRWVEKAALSSGLNPMQLVEALMPTILGAGLINVECYEYGIPIGDWAGRRGNVAMRSYLAMVESLREEIIEINRLEEGIFEETVALMRQECSVENAELIMKVICAQKPPFSDDIWR